MPVDLTPYAQANYQVRLEWGEPGLARLAPADIVVVVDLFGLSAEAVAAVDRGETLSPGSGAGARVARAASATGAHVVAGGIRSAAAVAAHVLDVQRARGERTSIAVIATGAAIETDAAPVRFAVEDLLGAGAVVAALGDLGIDHASPDAAVAGEGYRSLRTAVRHLLSASGTAREMAAAGRRDEVQAAAERDASSAVPVLRGDVFVAH